MSADDADALAMPLILFVEDEALISDMVVGALEEAGFSILVASSGEAGMALLSEHGHEIRGLITDINLNAAMDGWELARAARETVSDMPIVYVSGASGHEWASRGLPDSLMITKPFAPVQIVVAISTLLVASDTAG
jgi:two-component system, cell cycle response regulator CpdR